MKYFLAKALQLIGITSVGVGLVRGLSDEKWFGFEMQMLIVGSVIFVFGRLLEGRRAA